MKQSNVNTSNYSKKKKRLFVVIMCLGTLLICLSLLEIAVRIISPQSDIRRKDLFFQYEPFIGVGRNPQQKRDSLLLSHLIQPYHLTMKVWRDYNHEKSNTTK